LRWRWKIAAARAQQHGRGCESGMARKREGMGAGAQESVLAGEWRVGAARQRWPATGTQCRVRWRSELDGETVGSSFSRSFLIFGEQMMFNESVAVALSLSN
jgi:hypothetical protein